MRNNLTQLRITAEVLETLLDLKDHKITNVIWDPYTGSLRIILQDNLLYREIPEGQEIPYDFVVSYNLDDIIKKKKISSEQELGKLSQPHGVLDAGRTLEREDVREESADAGDASGDNNRPWESSWLAGFLRRL